MSGLEYVERSVSWLPTTIFILIILIAMLAGFLRGCRKSVIFLIHSIVAACICLFLYFLFKDNTKIDELIVSVANLILGESGLQNKLQVSPECNSLREIILEFILNSASGVDGLSLILKDNGAYILTLIELGYSIVFAALFYILYIIICFILAIIYHLFYSDRRYRKKDAKKIMKGVREHRYAKRRTIGTLIGLGRGLVSAFIYISFVGSIFYIVSGGDGTKKNEELDFGNNEINEVYNAYNSICEYGNDGVFKILNAFKDKDNNPYYLFAADIVFSGELKVNEQYTNNIIFREEIATYVAFSKDTLNLLLKYGGDDIKDVINKNVDSSEATNLLIKIMLKEEFQNEFEALIKEFDSKTYFSGLAISLIDSIISNVDELSFTSSLDSKIKDLLCILFKANYLSDSIPYEKALKSKLSNEEITDLDEYNIGHISAKDILNKDSMLCAYQILNYVLAYTYELGDNAKEEDLLKLIENLIPYLEKLSIFYPENSTRLNNVLKRLYAFVQYNYLEEDKEDLVVDQLSTKYYISNQYDSINWINELTSIVSSASDLIYMYRIIDIDFNDSNAIIDFIFSIYNPNSSNYAELSVKMDKIIGYLSSSRLLAEVLASSFVYNSIEDALTSSIEDYKMPNLKYANTYNEYGVIEEFGEVYYLLRAIKSLASNQENYELVKHLTTVSIDENNVFDIINDVCNTFTSDANKQTMDSLLSSRLIRSILSTFLYTLELDGNTLIYADKSILEAEDTTLTNIINENELIKVIYLLPELLELVKPMINGDFTNDSVAELLMHDSLTKLLDSVLIEGTISNIVVTFVKDVNQIIIPQSLIDKEGYVSTKTQTGEIKNIIDIIKELNIDFASLIEGNVSDSVDELLNNENIGKIFDSKILHYTISNYLTTNLDTLLSGFTVIIPNASKTILVNDTISSVIKKEAFLDFLDMARDLMPKEDEEITANEIIKKVITKKEIYLSNIIISATIINYLVNDAGLDDYLVMPTRFENLASREQLEAKYDNTSIWYEELFKVCIGLDEFFNISNSENFDLTNMDVMTDSIDSLLKDPEIKSNVDPEKTKLDVIYDSVIVAKTLSNEIDKKLTDDLISRNVKYSSLIYNSVDGYFLRDEIVRLANAISALGLSLNQGFDNSILSIPDTEEEKDKVFNSILVMGLITKMLDNIIDSTKGYEVQIRRMNLAYNQEYIDDFKIFNRSEIDSILDLFAENLEGLVSGSTEFNIESYTLSNFRSIMFDDDNNIKSYILVGTMSDVLVEYFYIPYKDYDQTLDIININSLNTLIDSLIAADFDRFDLDMDNFTFPEEEKINIIARSSILRATLSKSIYISGTNNIVVGVTYEEASNGNLLYLELGKDHEGNELSYLTEFEFTNTIKAISALLGESKSFEFEMNTELIMSIVGLSDEDKESILASCMIRCAINIFFETGLSLGIPGMQPINYDYFETIDGIGEIKTLKIRNLTTEKDIEARQATYEQFMTIFEWLAI